MKEKVRSGYWDNVKALLIFLVVLGHYFGYGFVYGDLSQGRMLIPNGIYGFVYMFHMPLFAFVSGYFSKNTDKCQKRAIPQYLIPYILFNTLCVVMNYFLLHVPLTNPILQPYNHMWYLFALFVWRLTPKYLQKLKINWIIFFAIAIILSVVTPVMEWDLLSRVFLFWPFFLLGLGMEEKQVFRAKKLPHWLCGAVLLCALAGGILTLWKFDCSTYMLGFIGRRFGLNMAGLKGLVLQILRYGVAFVLSICVLNLVPTKSGRLTAFGRSTMSVYLLHSLPKLRNTMNALNPLRGCLWFDLVWYTLWTVVAVILFGNRWVSGIINKFLGWIEALWTVLMHKLKITA